MLNCGIVQEIESINYTGFIYTLYRFENCWLAMESNADGYMLVYNPDDKNSEKELKLLYC